MEKTKAKKKGAKPKLTPEVKTIRDLYRALDRLLDDMFDQTGECRQDYEKLMKSVKRKYSKYNI